MKKFLFLTLLMFAPADLAAKVCMLNSTPAWLTELSNKIGAVPSVPATDYAHGLMWYAMYQGNLIEGISMCTESSSDPTIQKFGQYCWCRMIRPIPGSSWQFTNDDLEYLNCYLYCAMHCAGCARIGTYKTCTRAALLAH